MSQPVTSRTVIRKSPAPRLGKCGLALSVARILRKTYCSQLIGLRFRGAGTIVRLHSVVPDPAEHLFDHTLTSTHFLDDYCAWLRHRKIDILTLDQALARLHDPGANRFVVITLDDGYADNLVHALPILERYNAPFTVYIATCMIARQMDFWWAGLQKLFAVNTVVDFTPMEKRFACGTMAQKVAALHQVNTWVHADIPGRIPLVHKSLTAHNIDARALLDQQALTKCQLQRLAAHRLVTIGAHSTSHVELAKMDLAQATVDISKNRTFLEEITGRAVEHFAYPFGGAAACGRREEDLVKGLGFKTAVTARMGNLFSDHIERPYALPRVGFAADKESMHYMAALMDGSVQLFANRRWAAVTTM